MKVLMLAGFLLGAFTQAEMVTSAVELKAQDGKSLMDQVVDWYNSAQDLSYLEAKGYHVGRCFSFDQPNTGKSSLFAPLGVNNGPGFPEEPKILATLMHGRGLPADYYDPLTKASEVSGFFSESYKNEFGSNKYGPITEIPLSQLYDLEGNGRMDFRYEYRKKGDYIVVTATNLISQTVNINVMGSPKYANAGQIIYACYYFKKLAE